MTFTQWLKYRVLTLPTNVLGFLQECLQQGQAIPDGLLAADADHSVLVNLVFLLLRDERQTAPEYSVLDFKARCCGYALVLETINCFQTRRTSI